MEEGYWKLPEGFKLPPAQEQNDCEGDLSKAKILQMTVVQVNNRPTQIYFSPADPPITFGFNPVSGEGFVESETKLVKTLPANVSGPEQEILK